MDLNKMTFAKHQDDEYYPETITVTMTLKEAIFIAKKAGAEPPAATGTICDCLVGDVFNRYWDDGVDDAERMKGGE